MTDNQLSKLDGEISDRMSRDHKVLEAVRTVVEMREAFRKLRRTTRSDIDYRKSYRSALKYAEMKLDVMLGNAVRVTGSQMRMLQNLSDDPKTAYYVEGPDLNVAFNLVRIGLAENLYLGWVRGGKFVITENGRRVRDGLRVKGAGPATFPAWIRPRT